MFTLSPSSPPAPCDLSRARRGCQRAAICVDLRRFAVFGVNAALSVTTTAKNTRRWLNNYENFGSERLKISGTLYVTRIWYKYRCCTRAVQKRPVRYAYFLRAAGFFSMRGPPVITANRKKRIEFISQCLQS